MRRLRSWLWHRLVYLADRISPDDSFRCTGWTFTFEEGQGVVFHEDGQRGARIWYSGRKDFDRAWAEGISSSTPQA